MQDKAVGYTEDGNFTITQDISDVTLAGNVIEVWAYAFNNKYADATAALSSQEYALNKDNWSEPLEVTMPDAVEAKKVDIEK